MDQNNLGTTAEQVNSTEFPRLEKLEGGEAIPEFLVREDGKTYSADEVVAVEGDIGYHGEADEVTADVTSATADTVH